MNGEYLEELFRSAISEYFSAGGKILTQIPNEQVMKLAIAINQARKTESTVYISGYKKPGSSTDIRFAIQLRDNVRSILENNGTKLTLSIENRFGVFSKNKIKIYPIDLVIRIAHILNIT